MTTSDLYVGLLSGTSIDAVDAVIASFDNDQCQIIAKANHPIPDSVKASIVQLATPSKNSGTTLELIDLMGICDNQLGLLFAEATNQLLKSAGIAADKIAAVCSHGQTIRHRPKHRFTLQIGNPHVIAKETGIRTIADFRRKDMAYGGEGAPLVPPFHKAFFVKDKKNTAILNIGGIANVSLYSPQDELFLGFDTGPGNTLMDAWIFAHKKKSYDANGAWAAEGRVDQTLLDSLLSDEYFSQAPPKSTGREYFDLNWLESHLAKLSSDKQVSPTDIQCTLAELTAISIANGIRQGEEELPYSIYVCGGGGYNTHLMTRLQHQLPKSKLQTSETLGFPIDFVEACAFAWFGYCFDNKLEIDYRSITGSNRPIVPGVEYFP